MTLQAIEPSRVTIDRKRYSWCVTPNLPGWCSIPGCSSTFKLQKHHIVRRSATGGPLDFVTIDGIVTQNVCMLCREHHQAITGMLGGHKLWIVFGDGGWQVYKPGYFDDQDYLISKGNVTWVWVGALRRGNHQ